MAEFGTGGHPRKHCYTVKDISKLSGRAVGTIRNDSYKGKIDLNDLVSVFNYCIKYRKEYLISLCLEHGIISRGKACEYLGIDRCELDDWIEINEKTYKEL